MYEQQQMWPIWIFTLKNRSILLMNVQMFKIFLPKKDKKENEGKIRKKNPPKNWEKMQEKKLSEINQKFKKIWGKVVLKKSKEKSKKT